MHYILPVAVVVVVSSFAAGIPHLVVLVVAVRQREHLLRLDIPHGPQSARVVEIVVVVVHTGAHAVEISAAGNKSEIVGGLNDETFLDVK